MSESGNQAVIEMNGVSVGAMRDISFVVLEDVNWSVAPGEFWVVAGQQHSGKSDFLMLGAGLMAPVQGGCKLFGTETRAFGEGKLAERLHVGLVFTGGQLFNQLTLRENVALPLQYHHDLASGAAAQKVETLLDLLELKPLADVTPP
jgi:ABC-type transporter Mla maintaining outer membrane lipid asymmetry ATPase subunit MlaF